MSPIQPGILDPVPALARYLVFDLEPEAGPGPSLRRLAQSVDPRATVVGIGRSTALALGHDVPGLRDFPAATGRGIEMPATHGGLLVLAARRRSRRTRPSHAGSRGRARAGVQAQRRARCLHPRQRP